MVIIAATNDGVLISATSSEVCEVLNSVTGQTPKELKIGMKIPAIDYASSIKRVKTLAQDYAFISLRDKVTSFKAHMDALCSAVENAANITID